MSCQKCGHKREGDVQPHNYGCPESLTVKRRMMRSTYPKAVGRDTVDLAALECEHGECENPKRPQGKGPRPKYCDEHSTPKSRKE